MKSGKSSDVSLRHTVCQPNAIFRAVKKKAIGMHKGRINFENYHLTMPSANLGGSGSIFRHVHVLAVHLAKTCCSYGRTGLDRCTVPQDPWRPHTNKLHVNIHTVPLIRPYFQTITAYAKALFVA